MARMRYYRAYIDDGKTVYAYTFQSTPRYASAAWVTAVERAIANGANFTVEKAGYPSELKGICPSIFDLNLFIPVLDL